MTLFNEGLFEVVNELPVPWEEQSREVDLITGLEKY